MAISQHGKAYRYKDLEFYAEGGLVVVINTKELDNPNYDKKKQTVLRPGEFIKRAIAARMSVGDQYPDEAAEARSFLEEAAVVAKQAKAQQADFATASHKPQIIVPSDIAPALGCPHRVVTKGKPSDIITKGDISVVPKLILD